MIPATMGVDAHAATSSQLRFKIAVAFILIAAVLFRFYGQDWDDGHYFHPDERFIATVMDTRLSIPPLSDIGQLFDPANSPLNTRSIDEEGTPQEFAYGSLPFLVATILGTLLGAITNTDLLSYANVWEFGRSLTVIIDIGTVAIVILFTRKAFGELAAVIAGTLAAASVVLIQLAHFFTVDTWVTFFTIATLYASYRIMQDFDLRWSLVAAALGGAALATKVSVGVLGIPVIVAMIIGVQQVSDGWKEAGQELIRRLAVAAIPTIAVFAVFEPYAIWRPGPFIDDIQRQWEIVNGHFDIPFTRQFVGTISGVTEIENLVLWSLAPGFGVAAIVATGIGVYWAIKRRDSRYILLLSWVIPYFYVIASSEARFIRYAAPLVPPLAMMVGHLLSVWWYQSEGTIRARLLPGGSIAIVTGVTLVWALAFMTVYTGTHPRIDASAWIYENVEPGSTITHEIWDDRLPVQLATGSGENYQYLGLDLYADRTNEEAVDFVAEFLQDADYIVLSSQRLSHSIPRLPWRYPVQSEYYRLLEQEKLGFELAHEATNYPGFGPFRKNTLRADESFSVYDHPPVRIYRKVEELPREELELRFAYASAQPRIPQRYPDEPTLLLDAPVSERTVNPAAEWSSGVTSSGSFAIIVWLVGLTLIVVAGLPITFRLLHTFADYGVGFAPLVGALGVGVVTWLMWSLELTSLNLWTIGVVSGGFALFAWTAIGLPSDWRNSLSARKPVVIGSLVAFGSAFAFFLLLRALNPDLWHPIFGGEKPMETAYLNALLQTGEFPPHDPWFADGQINYYYYGFFLLAILWNLTGIPPEIAFQLSLATVAGLLASGLFSLGSTLTSSLLGTHDRRWMIAGGVTTTLLVMFIGNLQAIREIIGNRTFEVDFWNSSRVAEFAITEFPYFSLLYGDVHPHLLAAPVLVLIVALAYEWIRREFEAGVKWKVLWVASTGVVAGSLTMINLWDGPTAAVILGAAIVFPLLVEPTNLRERIVIGAGVMAGLTIIGWLPFARFYSDFSPQTDGLETTSFGTSVGELTTHFGGLAVPFLVIAGIAIYGALSRIHARPAYFLCGGVLSLGCYLAASIVASGVSDNLLEFILFGVLVTAVGGMITHLATSSTSGNRMNEGILLVVPFIAVAGVLVLVRPAAGIASLVVAAFLSFFARSRRDASATLLTIIGASGAGLVLIADLVFIADHMRNSDWERMNTVFKLYFQSWTLLGVAASAVVIWIAYRVSNNWGSSDSSQRPGVLRMRILIAVPAVAVFVAWFAYPLFATTDRLEHQMESSPSGMSLAGNDWMIDGQIQNETGNVIDFTGDHQAISWLNENASHNSVILEASLGAYRGGGSRISSATGLPTVLGWDGHQSQQRGPEGVGPRMDEVRELYSTDDLERKRYLLRRYRIEFVIVGDVERYTILGDAAEEIESDYYSSAAGLEAFETMVGEDLEIAHEADGTVIYRVLPFPIAEQSQ